MTRVSSKAIEIGGGVDNGDDFNGSVPLECHSYVDIGSVMTHDHLGSLSSSSDNRSQANGSLGRLSIVDAEPSMKSIVSPEKKDLFTDVLLLPGEEERSVNGEKSCPVDGGAVLLTNFRLILVKDPSIVAIFPLMALEQVDYKDPNQIMLHSKEGRCQRLTFLSYESAVGWHRQLTKIMGRLNKQTATTSTSTSSGGSSSAAGAGTAGTAATATATDPDEVFAWKFAQATAQKHPEWLVSLDEKEKLQDMLQMDFERLGMEEDFRVSAANMDFRLTETYPERIIVPKEITDEQLKVASLYRSLNRFPAVVWRSRETNAVLMRSAQAKVGLIFYCREPMDEKIVAEVAKAGCKDEEKRKQFVIIDARTYTAALANHARGGGIEKPEYYQNAKLDFAGLPNIHAVRNSFIALRTLLNSGTNNESSLQELQTTGWMINLSNLLRWSSNCADYLLNGQSVLVHCSDGWDRTTQIVSLAKIMLDEHYRTIDGFEQLIRREWLAFGHKFFDRQQNYNGNWEAGERAPIFLQFLEAVRHLQKEVPTAFQFTQAYLLKIAHHAYSGLFGTFMFNSLKERREAIAARGCPVPSLVDIWQFIGTHNEEFVNQNYNADYKGALRSVKLTVLHLTVWNELFRDSEKKKDLVDAVAEQTTTTQSPVKDVSLLERPASGAMTSSTASTVTPSSLLKSKSSESVNSIGTLETSIVHPSGHTPTVGHQLSDSPSSAHSMHATMSSSGVFNCSMMSTSIQDPAVKTVRERLDHDGLLKFEDAEQELMRRKNAKQNEKIQKLGEVIKRKDERIQDLQTRQRSISEVLQHSPPGHHPQQLQQQQQQQNGTRMNSVGEGESDGEENSLGRALSDLSVIGDQEVPEKEGTVLQVDGKRCASCNKKFGLIFGGKVINCPRCLKKVCSSCTQNKMHDSNNGKNETKNICNVCYDTLNTQSPRHSDMSESVIDTIDGLCEYPMSITSMRSTSTSSLSGGGASTTTAPKSSPIPIGGGSPMRSPCKSSSSNRPLTERSPTADSFGSHVSSTQAVQG